MLALSVHDLGCIYLAKRDRVVRKDPTVQITAWQAMKFPEIIVAVGQQVLAAASATKVAAVGP